MTRRVALDTKCKRRTLRQPEGGVAISLDQLIRVCSPAVTEAQESHYLDGQGSLRLEEGDSIRWDGTLPYRVENIGNNDVRLLIAVAPASLWQHGGEEASNGTSTPVQVDSLEHSARRGQSVQE